jgi:flavin reductase (DIM6/NTAB) family NADH-FMN oxidoreductase RutF
MTIPLATAGLGDAASSRGKVSPVAPEPVPLDQFTEAMAGLVSGLTIVTARAEDGRPSGLLVSSLCSYSTRPPSILMSVGRATRSYRTLAVGTRFGVHLLDRHHAGAEAIFASRRDDKVDALGWHWGVGVPRLDAAALFLVCRVRRMVPDGDHAVVIGDVVLLDDPSAGEAWSREPLVYYRRRLGTWYEVFAVDATATG